MRHITLLALFSAMAVLSLTLSGCPKHNGPQAAFTALPSTGPAPLDVQFTDASTPGDAPIGLWQWDFGDGASGSGQNPLHRYETPGVYSPRLHVETQYGQSTYVLDNPITVTGEGEGEGESEGPLVEIPDPLSPENPRFFTPTAAVPAPGHRVADADFNTVQDA